MTKDKTKDKTARASFSLRLQPYEGSLLAEVVNYLNSLDRAEANRRVEGVLVMAMLAQARLYDPACSETERRRCCIEACDALEKHASMLRQLVGVEMPMHPVIHSYAMGVMDQAMNPAAGQQGTAESDGAELSAADDFDQDDEDEVTSAPKAKINAIAAAEDVNSLFG